VGFGLENTNILGYRRWQGAGRRRLAANGGTYARRKGCKLFICTFYESDAQEMHNPTMHWWELLVSLLIAVLIVMALKSGRQWIRGHNCSSDASQPDFLLLARTAPIV
jgi:hypothetical protein